MRVIDYNNSKFIEYTAFLDFPEFIVFCVLTTTNETVKKNIKKLEYLIEKILPMRMQFRSDEEAAEFHLRRAIKENSDLDVKAYFARQLGFHFIDRLDEQKALWYFKLSNRYKSNVYPTLGPLATIQLKLRAYNGETRKLLDSFFNLDPSNPTIYNEILSMFSYAQKESLLIEYLSEKIPQHQSDKMILGNLHYYLGLAFNAFEDVDQAKENLEKADRILKQVLPSDSEVFNKIRILLQE